jgi:hypothetical protein
MGGHLSKGKSLKQIAEMHNVSLAHINEELAKGLEVEKEHFTDFKERTRVAKDHLVENPDYYTILEKAGLKNGGHIQSQKLVRKSKKEDISSRDLDEYNDVLDVQADEVVGGDSGLAFADGGSVNSKKDKTYELKLDYRIGQTFEKDKLGGKYTCRILAMDFNVNENGEVNHNSYYIHYFDGDSNSEQSSHYSFLKHLKKEPNQVKINVPYSIGSNIYYESSEYGKESLSLLKSNVVGFQVMYYGQRVGWFDYYLDSKESVDSKDAYSSVENYLNKVSSEITSTKLSSLKKLNQFVEPTSEKINVKVDYFIGQKFKLPVMGGFEDAEIIGIDLRFDKDKTYPNSERSVIHYKEEDGRIRERELKYFIEETKQQKPNEIEVIVKAKVKDDVLILHRYMGGSKLQITQVQGYVLKLNDSGVNLEYCVSDDCYNEKSVYTSIENFKESIIRKNKKKIDEVDDISELLEMVKSGNYANGGITPYDANIEGDSVDIIENEFANGGGVELPKVSYVTVSGTGSSLEKLIGNRYNSYIEFAESVEYAYKELGKKVRSYVQLQAFDENSIALIDVTTYISDQKNTIKNFNPLTGNYKNLEKSLANSRPRSFQKFNWQDWLLSKVTPSVQTTNLTNKSASTSAQSQYPEYYEYVGNTVNSFTKGKIYKINYPNDLEAEGNFIDNNGYTDGFSGSNYEKFKPSTKEAFLLQQNFTSSNNSSSAEPKIVDAVNVEFIYPNGRIETSTTINISNLKNALANFWNIVDKKSWEVLITPFENQFTPFAVKELIIGSDFAEFNPETFSEEQLGNKLKSLYPDLDWSYFLKEKTTTSTNALNSAQKFDFTDTKIDVEDNPDLSLRVQKKAFEEGWEWENGGGKTLDYDDFNYLYFTKTSVSYGNITSSFLKSPKRKITEEEIFGSQPSSSIKTTAISNEVTHINLRYEKNGTQTYYSGLAGGKEFIEAINSIEQANPIQEVSVNVAVSYKADNRIGGSTTEKLVENINFGKGAFQPSNFNVSEIKSIVENDWFDGKLDFNDFFRDIVSTVSTSTIPTSNSAVPKTVENAIYNLDLAVQKLEKASSTVVTEYNKEIYDKSLKFLYDTKATYELALKFTPESAFMYERLDILKKLADIEKNIKKIEDMKKGGTFYMLAKILEKLERGENWKQSESAEDVITNHIPKSEIEIIIRSQKFKNWFGDWEKALINDEYDNVSKALTDGIPSVYHHGARRIKYTYREVSNGVLYLAENISYALWFSQNSTAQSEEGNYLTECFVNIKNPIDLTAFNVNEIDFGDLIRYIDAIYPMANIYDFVGTQVALLVKSNQPTNIIMRAWQLIRKYAKFVKHVKENTPYDGFLYYENNPDDKVINPTTGQLEQNVTKAVAIFKSHQVKVVDAVLFDGGLDDWRFENGGKIKN